MISLGLDKKSVMSMFVYIIIYMFVYLYVYLLTFYFLVIITSAEGLSDCLLDLLKKLWTDFDEIFWRVGWKTKWLYFGGDPDHNSALSLIVFSLD